MADVEVVIKIPEEEYKYLKMWLSHSKSLENLIRVHKCFSLEYAVFKGTPLPKGHGRLIDADALKKDDEVTEWISLNPVRTGKMLKSFSELFVKKIDATKTIVEADKELYE